MKPIVLLAGLLCSVLAWCQDPQLFDNVWFNQSITIDGTTYITPSNTEIPFVKLLFDESNMTFETMVCNSGSGNISFDMGNPDIIFFDIVVSLITCQDGQNDLFDSNYFSFYLINETDPFTYIITIKNNGDKTLVINAANGDQAIYGNQILSIYEQDLVTISIYPNPVVAEVQIDANIAIHDISVYGVLGQQIRHKLFAEPRSAASLDLTSLKSGLYFVELKDTKGRSYIERLVKR